MNLNTWLNLAETTLIVIGLVLIVYCGNIRRISGTGKYITIPMVKAFFMWRWRNSPGAKNILISGSMVRIYQMFALFAISAGPLFALPAPYNTISYISGYAVPLIVLYVDDIVTHIDNDKWKKRFKALKNKVKWKWLPAPAPTVG